MSSYTMHQCSWKTLWFIRHLSNVLYIIIFKFVKSLIRHLGLAIGNVRHVWWFSWTLMHVRQSEVCFWQLIKGSSCVTVYGTNWYFSMLGGEQCRTPANTSRNKEVTVMSKYWRVFGIAKFGEHPPTPSLKQKPPSVFLCRKVFYAQNRL